MSRTRASRSGGVRTVGWVPWALMVTVAVVLLAVGSLGGDPPTLEERSQNLEESIRCPSCASQSVANSDAPSAEGVRVLIRERLEMGNSDEEIRDYVAASYPNGHELLLDPSGSGFGALVWAVPVFVAVVAVAALVRRFGDWRPGEIAATDEDRALVDAARSGHTDPGPGADPDGGADPVDAAPDLDGGRDTAVTDGETGGAGVGAAEETDHGDR